MRVIKVDTLGVTEIKMDFDEFMECSDVNWNYHPIDDYNNIWVEEGRLWKPGADTAEVDNCRVSLPAYIVGVDGEFWDDTTFSLAEIVAMTKWTTPVRKSA